MTIDRMTYTRCELCGGRGIIIEQPPEQQRSRMCLCARSATPGLNPTGLTIGQLDRLANLERALAGDPGIPAARQKQILEDLADRLTNAWLRRWEPNSPKPEGSTCTHST